METTVIRLRGKEKRILRHWSRRGPRADERIRAGVVLALGRGMAPRVVSGVLGVALGSVYRVRDRYCADGLWGLRDGRRDRSDVKTTPDLLVQLEALLAEDPRALGWNHTRWSCELAGLELKRRTGVSFHRSWIHVLMCEIRMRWGRARPSVRHLNPRRWRQWRRVQRDLAELGPREVILFADEADLDLNPKIGFMWMPRGQQIEIPTPGKNQKAYLAGALNIATGHVVAVAGPRKNSALFVALLERVASAYRWAVRIHVLVDQYKIHFSRLTNRALARFGGRVVLHRIPTYSPQLNAIERLWKKMHDAVTRNHGFRTMRQLLAAVRDFLREARPFITSNPLTLRRAA